MLCPTCNLLLPFLHAHLFLLSSKARTLFPLLSSHAGSPSVPPPLHSSAALSRSNLLPYVKQSYRTKAEWVYACLSAEGKSKLCSLRCPITGCCHQQHYQSWKLRALPSPVCTFAPSFLFCQLYLLCSDLTPFSLLTNTGPWPTQCFAASSVPCSSPDGFSRDTAMFPALPLPCHVTLG